MTTREKNQLPCNKAARKRYKETHCKYQTVCFKIPELDAINSYCAENNIPKNTFSAQSAWKLSESPLHNRWKIFVNSIIKILDNYLIIGYNGLEVKRYTKSN